MNLVKSTIYNYNGAVRVDVFGFSAEGGGSLLGMRVLRGVTSQSISGFFFWPEFAGAEGRFGDVPPPFGAWPRET